MKKALWGMVTLAGLALLLFAARPTMTRLLPAANLAYLLRDGHYLVLFQNNAELRASGGFIGSFAEVAISHGQPGPIDFGTNIYKLDEPFTKQVTIPPPPPLTGITFGKWSFHDSNWAADFPEAAKQILWFFERETGMAGKVKKMDGVIALTTTVVEEMLRLVGPIDMPEYATTLTADNFAEVAQYKIEKEYFENRANWPVDEPKTILKDFLPLLESRLRSADKSSILSLAFRLLDEKYIVLYANDPLAEKIILERNWGGRVDRTRENYLYLVNSNIQGVKSSRKINERVRYSLDLEPRRVTLYLEREHTGTGIWPDAENKNWVRVLVPKGSKLASTKLGLVDSTKEIDVGEEAGKTVFGFWLNTEPKHTQDATIIYELPVDVDLSKLVIQRQPGANPDQMTIIVGGDEKFEGSIIRDMTIPL